jgi:transposase-like protein
MGAGKPLSAEEREQIYAGWLTGQRVAAIAQRLGRSAMTVRKWWRRLKHAGLAGLTPPRRGRPARGPLAQFVPELKAQAVALKHVHPRWGAARVRIELAQQPAWAGQALPSVSRLAALFKAACPEAVHVRVPRSAPAQAPLAAEAVHAVWQIDHQEKIVLQDGTLATICNVRDPVGAAMLASQAFGTQTPKRWRKLTTPEVQSVLRAAFREWRTMPDSVLTDNELGLAGSPQELFPSRLTLWLRGLGIVHRRIRPHRPTDQPQVERTHRTLDELTADPDSRAHLPALQAALDRERWVYNHLFPCRASDCHGQPPLRAYPQLTHARRPYPAEGDEEPVFELQRVFDYLATLQFERQISSIGVLNIGHVQYYLGRPFAGKRVRVQCDPASHEWLIYERRPATTGEAEPLMARQAIRKLDFQTLSGLEPKPIQLRQSLQLSLPCLTAA